MKDEELRVRLAIYLARLPVHGSIARMISLLGSCGYRVRQIGEYPHLCKVSFLAELHTPDAVSIETARDVLDEHTPLGCIATVDPWP